MISRSGFTAEGITVVDSIDAALENVGSADEVMIIGGANLYEQMIAKADRMYLTHVDADCEGDAWFPDFNKETWEKIGIDSYKADESNNYNFDVVTYQKKR